MVDNMKPFIFGHQKVMSCLVLAFTIAYSTSSSAAPVATETAVQSQSRYKELASLTLKEMQLVRSGLHQFYIANSGAWPSNLSAISDYYSGTFSTPAGNIQGVQTTNGYELFINTANLDDQMKTQMGTELAKNNGGWNGNRAIVKVDAPQAAAIVRSSLSRFADPSGTGETNTMYTNLLMNGNDINGVGEVNAAGIVANAATIDQATLNTATLQQANITNSNVGTAVIDTATIDTASLNLATINQATIDSLTAQTTKTNTLEATSATLTNATVDQNLSVGGVTTLGGPVTIAGATNLNENLYMNGVLVLDKQARSYYQGQDIDTRYLGILDTAANSDQLGGIDASKFARTDISNTFTAPQTFSNGINVGGTGITTTNLDASGNLYANNVYVKSRSEWLSATIDKANSAYSRVGTLESKVNSGIGNKMGIWYNEGTYTADNIPGNRIYLGVCRSVQNGCTSSTLPTVAYSCVVGTSGYIKSVVGSSNNSTDYYRHFKCQ